MSDNSAIAILIIGFFGFCAWAVSIFLVVFVLVTHTDLNNWLVGLCAWGTSMIIGVPLRLVLRALQG